MPKYGSLFQLAIISGENAARDASQHATKQLTKINLPIEELSTVELVLAEALNNIVEHAYPEPKKPGPIRLWGTHQTNGVHIRIEDEGLPMPGGQAPVGMQPNLNVGVSALPEGGFGWFLIHDLAKDINYRRLGEMNRLDMRLPVALTSSD